MAERSSGPSGGVGAELRDLGHGLSELEFVKRNFDDPSHEWRRLFAEVLGTFFLVLVGAGGGVVDAVSNGAIGRGASVTAPGLMVMAIILAMGRSAAPTSTRPSPSALPCVATSPGAG